MRLFIYISTMLSLLFTSLIVMARDGSMPLRDGSLPLDMSGSASIVVQQSRQTLPLKLNISKAEDDQNGEDAQVTCETLNPDRAKRLVISGQLKLGQITYRLVGACSDEDANAVELFGSVDGVKVTLFGRTAVNDKGLSSISGRLSVVGSKVNAKYSVALLEM